MGLPLYKPPPDPKTKSRSEPEKNSAHSRSSIRRNRLHPSEQASERRRRFFTAASSGSDTQDEATQPSRHQSPAAPNENYSSSLRHGIDGTFEYDPHLSGQRALRNLANRMGLAERWPLIRSVRVLDTGTDDIDNDSSSAGADTDVGSSYRYDPPYESYVPSYSRSSQRVAPSSSVERHPFTELDELVDEEHRFRPQRGLFNQPYLTRLPTSSLALDGDEHAVRVMMRNRRQIPTGVDSLRRRFSLVRPMRSTLTRSDEISDERAGQRSQDLEDSLSAENNSTWDTLYPALTPDPQPPSAWPSFASTTALGGSANFSQGLAGVSNYTSLTLPDTHTDNVHFQSCDSE